MVPAVLPATHGNARGLRSIGEHPKVTSCFSAKLRAPRLLWVGDGYRPALPVDDAALGWGDDDSFVSA